MIIDRAARTGVARGVGWGRKGDESGRTFSYLPISVSEILCRLPTTVERELSRFPRRRV